jgi:hypothetical protein
MIARSALPQASNRYHGRGVVLSMSGGQAANQLGITLTSLYMLDDASGSIADEMGGTALAVTGAPTFRRVDAAGGIGVHYTAAGQLHSADVNALGSASGWYAVVFEDVSKAAVLSGVCGRINAGATECAVLYMQTTGAPSMLINDAAAGSLALQGVVVNPKTTGGAWLAQLQIDRTAAVARSRWSSIGGGVVEEVSGSIAGFGSLDGAAQVFGFGALPNVAYGAAVSWGAAATGVQCEGASFLATMARRLGVE